MAEQADRLQLDRNDHLHHIEWRVQRVAWILWGLILLAGLAGLFGDGPLSEREEPAPDGSLRVRYPRLARHHSAYTMEVTFDRPKAGREPFRLWVNRDFLDAVEIRRIQPEPVESEARSDGTVFVFRPGADGRRGRVSFHFEAELIGRSTLGLRLDEGEMLSLPVFVYP